MTLRSWLFPLVLALSAGIGCGDDDGPPSAFIDAGPMVDSGGRDGGPAMDGGDRDASLPDGSVLDGAPGDGGVIGCAFTFDPESDVMLLSTDSVARERIVPLASNASGFVAIWTETALGIPDVYGRQLAPDGRLQAKQPITTDTSRAIDPTITAVGTDYLASWVDNSEGGFEVYARTLGSDLMSPGTTHRLTDNSNRDDSPALLPTSSGVLAAWIEDDMVAATRTAHTRQLSVDGEPTAAADPVTGSDQAPGAPVLAPRSGGSALVWAEKELDDSNVVLMPLDASGGAAGTAVTLNTEGNANGTVDAALTESGGAVVFGVSVAGVRPEVRFQAVTGSGARLGDEIILTRTPESGRDASIVGFRGGYLVTYRAIEDEGLTEPTLRITLLSATGDRLETHDLVPVAATGGRTTVRVSPGGDAIAVTWADPTASETEIRMARIACD